MVPANHQQGELLQIKQLIRKIGQLVLIQEKGLQFFQPKKLEKESERKNLASELRKTRVSYK